MEIPLFLRDRRRWKAWNLNVPIRERRDGREREEMELGKLIFREVGRGLEREGEKMKEREERVMYVQIPSGRPFSFDDLDVAVPREEEVID
jgi:hypothetical protein